MRGKIVGEMTNPREWLPLPSNQNGVAENSKTFIFPG